MQRTIHLRSLFKLSLLMLVILAFKRESFSQDLSIQGSVKSSENEEPVIGATVSVIGKTLGTVSNTYGKFELKGVGKYDTLLVSSIGFETKRFLISGEAEVSVILTPANSALHAIVVVGYGTQRKEEVTGSVASANIENFKDIPIANIAQSLQGTVPGLNVGQVDHAGQTPGISIRGQNTISGNSNALIILDGVPFSSSLSAIDPNDIKSIDVLKDASSTAVYGAQAANGVILITTKSGKGLKHPRLTISSSYSIQEATKKFRPMKRQEYLDHIRDLFWDEAYLPPDYTTLNPNFDLASKADRVLLDDNGNFLDNNYDWWKAGTNRWGKIKEIKTALQGGGERMNYLISLGLIDQTGLIKNDFFGRKNIRLNMDSKPLDWLQFGIRSFGSFVDQDGDEPTMSDLTRSSPLLTPYDSVGNLITNPFNTLDKNPFLSYSADDYDRKNYFSANIYAEIHFPFLKGLKYRINFGNNYTVSNHFYSSKYGAGLTGNAYKNYENYYDFTLDNILTYDKNIGKNHIEVTLLYGASKRTDDNTSSSVEGLDRITLGYNSLQVGNNQFANSNAWSEALEYQMGRINYSFQDRYFLTGTIRRDGFSGFASNYKFAIFPSLSAGWIISREHFFNISVFNFLKLRAGYGVSGNQTKRYNSLSKLTVRPAYVFGDGGTTAFGQEVETLANPNLKWERTTGLNIGIDFGMVHNRVNGSLDYYNNITTDLLFDIALPNITGFQTISSNVGKLRNSGFELSINSQNINNANFKWTSTVNFSTNNNKILRLLGRDANHDGKEDDLVASGLFIGEPIGAIYDYETDGIYQIHDSIPSGYSPGAYRIVDLNEDGKINSNDRKILGKAEPEYRFSIFNEFTFGDVSFSFLINSIQGGKNGYLGNDVRPILERNDNNIRYNYFSGMDYWMPANPNAHNPRTIIAPAISPNIYVSRSFIRLQDVTLSYNLNKSILKRTFIEDANIYLSGVNLITLTNWLGWDPETNQGLTIDGRPVLRSYTVGFNLSF